MSESDPQGLTSLRFLHRFSRINHGQFTPYGLAGFSQHEFRVTAVIIGNGHLVRAEIRGHVHTELLTSEKIEGLPSMSATDLYSYPVDEAWEMFRYQCYAGYVPMAVGGTAFVSQFEREASRSRHGIIHRFPQGELASAPTTIVIPVVKGGQLTVTAVHAFPGMQLSDGGVVLSRSRLSLESEH